MSHRLCYHILLASQEQKLFDSPWKAYRFNQWRLGLKVKFLFESFFSIMHNKVWEVLERLFVFGTNYLTV